jgi:hypothetical protein
MAGKIADELGYPIVLKVVSPQITHKTDVGGVALSLTSAREVAAAYEAIVSSSKRHVPDARIDGYLHQPAARVFVEAIGGIDRQNLPDVLAAGCRRVAVSAAVVRCSTVAHLEEILGEGELGAEPEPRAAVGVLVHVHGELQQLEHPQPRPGSGDARDLGLSRAEVLGREAEGDRLVRPEDDPEVAGHVRMAAPGVVLQDRLEAGAQRLRLGPQVPPLGLALGTQGQPSGPGDLALRQLSVGRLDSAQGLLQAAQEPGDAMDRQVQVAQALVDLRPAAGAGEPAAPTAELGQELLALEGGIVLDVVLRVELASEEGLD